MRHARGRRDGLAILPDHVTAAGSHPATDFTVRRLGWNRDLAKFRHVSI
jgi:hypothetical protein